MTQGRRGSTRRSGTKPASPVAQGTRKGRRWCRWRRCAGRRRRSLTLASQGCASRAGGAAAAAAPRRARSLRQPAVPLPPLDVAAIDGGGTAHLFDRVQVHVGPSRGVVERSAYRLLQRDDCTLTRLPGRAGRHVTWVRALSHATILIPIKIDNERLRPAELKCDETLHPKSAERKRADRNWDLTMQLAGVACRQDSIWFLTIHDASDPWRPHFGESWSAAKAVPAESGWHSWRTPEGIKAEPATVQMRKEDPWLRPLP